MALGKVALKKARRNNRITKRDKKQQNIKTTPRKVRGVDAGGNQMVKKTMKPLSNGLALVAACMAAHGRRGNPRDYIVMSEHCKLYDGERIFEVQATLPAKLDKGDHVYLVNTTTPKQPMMVMCVVDDFGAEVLLSPTFSMDEVHRWPRTAIYPTAITGTATPIHKSQLAGIIGEKIAANWWHPTMGRVNHKLRATSPSMPVPQTVAATPATMPGVVTLPDES